MVKYECFRCGYYTIHRNSMKNHLNRKNICNPIEDDVEIEEIKKYYGFEIIDNTTQNTTILPQNTTKSSHITNTKIPQNTTIFSKNTTKIPQNTTILHTNKIIKNTNIMNKFQCEYCSKILSRYDSLNRHLKICKKKKESEILEINQKEEITKMKQEIEELKHYKIHTQNNITNNTTNNTININNYGNENLNHLRSKDFAGLLNGIYAAVPKLIEKIHFDPKHPENQNIKFTNRKLPYLKIMKDDKWQLVNKKHELLDLIDAKCYMLKEKYYSILEKKKYNISDVQRSKIDKFMKQYNEEDKKMMIDLIERTELMLLNNS